MSNDLERFLQQAAERLAQKSGAQRPPQGSRPGSGRPMQSSQGGNQPNQPRRQEPARRVAQPPVVAAEVVNAEPVSDRRLREMGPDPLSSIDTRPSLAQQIGQADERMGDHVNKVFDHELSQMRPSSSALQGNEPDRPPAPVKPGAATTLVKMLRSPDTLRAAFIAGEIFNRREW